MRLISSAADLFIAQMMFVTPVYHALMMLHSLTLYFHLLDFALGFFWGNLPQT
jgi:hypothetical protein